MDATFQRALELALRFLTQHDLTGLQVAQKMERAGVEPSAASEVVEWLRVRSFVSEERLTESLLLNSRWTRDKGDALLREKLQLKGVPDPVIESVLAEVPVLPEVERAAALIQTKFRGDRSPRRVAGFLHRKGFREETIEQILESDLVDPPSEDANTDISSQNTSSEGF